MSVAPGKRALLYGGLAVTTASTLLLELVLTRIFSVVMYYHFAFLAISLALFGLGAAGIYLYLRPNAVAKERFFSALSIYASLAAATTVFALWLVLRQRVSLDLAGVNLWALTKIYLAVALPFFFAGLCVTAMINRFSADMGRLYFWDLIGAAVGCLALTAVLAAIGGVRTVLLCGGLFALSGLLFALGRTPVRWWQVALPTLALLGVVAITTMRQNKPLLQIPSVKGTKEDRVVFAKWNSFSRITVEQLANDYMWLKMDSSAATRIFAGDAETDGWQTTRRFSETRVASLVYALRQPGKALIIGPGGGADVIAALYFGQTDITGVELNPITVHDVMLGKFKRYSGGLYARPEVRVVVGEGRNFIRSAEQQYTSIQATLVDTWAATSAGAFTLSENTLYTMEAFTEYLDHLEPTGIVTMTRWLQHPPREFLRLLSVGRAALDQMGVKDSASHFYVAADARMATFLLKRTPFSEEEVQRLDAYVQTAKLRRIYSPFDASLENAYANFLRAPDWQERTQSYPLDIRPPTDDRPFFFYTVKPERILSVFGNMHKLTKDNLGLLMLLIVLALVFLLVALFFLLPLCLFRRRALQGDRLAKARYISYFVCLGAGFIIVEIALMQKFILFLGHPTHALIVVLFALLVFSGAGSLLSRKVDQRRASRQISQNLALFTGLILIYAAVLARLFDSLATLPFAWRVLVALTTIAPLGLLMGTFLPIGIQAAGDRFRMVIPWAWGMNGAASVLGSALAIALAMNLGFNMALLTGLAFYLIGFGLVRAVLYAAPRGA